uniref:Uncharacterized protein n=1 Tax=Anguilla anguilla TaxID=7936 RepID=A0A0E9T5E8_ANGAN
MQCTVLILQWTLQCR